MIYAGNGIALLDDWFFLQSDINIHQLSLDDAKIHLKRTGKEWNYQFLATFLGEADQKKTSNPVQLNLKNIHLTNISFQSLDLWKGEDMIVHLAAADFSFQKTDFINDDIRLHTIHLQKPVFKMVSYLGTRTEAEEKIALSDTTTWRNATACRVNHLSISDGSFVYQRPDVTSPQHAPFNENNFSFFGINGSIDQLMIKGI